MEKINTKKIIRKAFILLFACFASFHSFAQISIGIFQDPLLARRLNVKIQSASAISSASLDSLHFTLRYSINTVSMTTFFADYGLVQEGIVKTDGGFNYIEYKNASVNPISFTAGEEKTVLTIDHSASGTACTGSVSIASDAYTTTSLEGNFKVILNMANQTSGIYATSAGTLSPITIVDTTHVNPTCNNIANGSITVTATGTTLTYSKDGGATYPHTSGSIPSVGAGTYPIVVRDGNGCTLSAGTIVVTQPNPIILNLTPTSPTCFGLANGSIQATASGDFEPFTYSIDNGPFSSTSLFPNVLGGSHQVVVLDTKGCPKSDNVNVTQPAAMSISVNAIVHVLTCNGDATGSVAFSAVGGGGGLQYSLNNVDYQPTGTFINKLGGIYTAYAKDVNNCTQSTQFEILQPAPIQVNAIVNDLTCYGQSNASIVLDITGGSAPYTFDWNGSWPDVYEIYNLTPGTYTCTVKDQKNCSTIYQTVISDPPLFLLETEYENISCNKADNGSIYATVQGGVPPYKYRWSNGARDVDQLNDLIPGEYSVYVEDSRNCSLSENFILREPEEIILTLDVTNVTYFGESDGAINLSVYGGSVSASNPYRFLWSNGEITEDLENIAIGDYSVVVTDTNNCKKSDSKKVISLETDVKRPTLFTPNNDGHNDTWELKGILKYPQAQISIYNSMGDLVFENSENGELAWDGKSNNGVDCPSKEVYYYIIKLDKNTSPLRGYITIIR